MLPDNLRPLLKVVGLVLFRGALDVRARAINTEMLVATVHALSELAREPVPQVVLDAYGKTSMSFGKEYIIPTPLDPRLRDLHDALRSGCSALRRLKALQPDRYVYKLGAA